VGHPWRARRQAATPGKREAIRRTLIVDRRQAGRRLSSRWLRTGGQPAVRGQHALAFGDEHREQLGQGEFLARVYAVGIRIQPTGSDVQHLPRPAALDAQLRQRARARGYARLRPAPRCPLPWSRCPRRQSRRRAGDRIGAAPPAPVHHDLCTLDRAAQGSSATRPQTAAAAVIGRAGALSPRQRAGTAAAGRRLGNRRRLTPTPSIDWCARPKAQRLLTAVLTVDHRVEVY
jgi:hypothetical protein